MKYIYITPQEAAKKARQIEGSLANFHYYHVFIAIFVFNANSVDPDQTPPFGDAPFMGWLDLNR